MGKKDASISTLAKWKFRFLKSRSTCPNVFWVNRGGISRDMNYLSSDLQLELMRWSINNCIGGSSYTNYVPLCIIDDPTSAEICLPVSWLGL